MSITNEATRIQTAKANIKSMIEAKGENITIPSNATLEDYPTYLGSLYTEYDNKISTATASETAVLNRISALETSFKQALTAKGETITGTETLEDFATIISNISTGNTPIEVDWHNGFAYSNYYQYQDNAANSSDIYEVKSGVTYMVILGSTVGNRFRAVTVSTDIRTSRSEGTKITGTLVANYADTQVTAYMKSNPFTPESNGYLVVTKDNAGTLNIPTYLIAFV